MKKPKNKVWEESYSDNFKPNLLEQIIKKLEVSRRDVITGELPVKGGSLLDLACGDGEILLSMSGRFKKLYGIDIASNRIKNAKREAAKQGIKNIDFMLSDLDKGIPLKDGSVDYVVCEASLSYFYDTDSILKEVWRVLKDNGYLVLEVPNYAFITRRMALFMGILPKTSSFPGVYDGGALHYFTYKSLKQILSMNKFKVVKSTNSGVFPGLRKIYPELLAGDIIYICRKLK